MQMSSPDWGPLEHTDPGPAMVMIIDDDPDLVCDLSELLESEGYEVATASDGLDALNQLRQGLRPSAILLDLMMPRMDGWDFRHEQLRDDELKEIPTIVLTAAGFSKASVMAQFGSIEFVPKSAGHAVLLRTLRQSCADL